MRYLFSFLTVLIIGANCHAQLANWTPVPAGTNFPTNLVGQINGMTRICQMKFHSTNNNKFYAVTAEGGLFTSTNQATSWTVAPGTETLTSSCAAVCVDYTNDQTIWLGTGDPNYYSNGQGIYKSINGGLSFTATSLINCLVIEILQNPINSNEYIAATNKGLYKTTNAGVNWAATTATTLPFCDMKSNATVNSQTVYACTNENIPKFFRSTDFGTSWTQITAGIVASNSFVTGGARIGVTPASPNVVYLEIVGGGGILHKSNNGGLSFNVKKPEGNPYLAFYSNTVTSSGQGNYNHAIAVDRTDPAKVWIQSHNTWFSADSGATWNMLTFWPFLVHTDMHQIEQAPFDNTKLYSCNDGGIWLSNDGGNTWTQKTNGICAFEIGNETGVSSLTKKDFVSIGTQDNARLYGNSNGWYTISGGDDYAKRQFDYNGHIYYDGINRQLNHTGASGTYGLPTANWNSFGFNRTNPNLGFMGLTELYRTINLASAAPVWTQISNFNQTVRAVHSCIADPNRLYVLMNSAAFYVTNNALSPSPSFTLYSIPGSASARGSIAAMANNADVVYVCANNAVYRSANGGASWTTVTANLPNVNHRRILAEQHDGSQELVFVATNNAVYYKKIGQANWTIYSTGLPSRRSPTEFSMFDDGTNQARIRYASYGRAMWESAFDNLRAFSAQINFKGDSVITCNSPFIQVEDGSVGTTNTPITYTWNFPGGTPSVAFTPTVSVSYSTTGIYTISLTIKDAINSVSTKTLSKFIQVISCNPDTIPYHSIFVQNNGNYAKTPSLAIGTTNSITLMAWIKIDVAQPAFAGIIFSPNGNATGLNFRTGNQIGYHYNDAAATYNYAGGPVIPTNLWTHVALVTSANSATIYVNGVPYVNNTPHAAVNFSSGFNLGNDRDNLARTMNGLMEEVCIYKRALSQNEIREQMHLTKNHVVTDPGLVAYYQCNELGQTVFDRAGNANANLLGVANHQLSTAPVGSGKSERQTIVTPGVKTFTAEGVSLTFPAASLPNGEICITRLNIPPDSVPAGNTFNNAATKYWIINNYGTNTFFNPLTNISLSGYGNVLPVEALNPQRFKLYKRVTGGYLASSWMLNDSAYVATAVNNSTISYNGNAISDFNSQFTIIKTACQQPSISNVVSNGNVNPVCKGNTANLVVLGSLNYATSWKWYTGGCGAALTATGISINVSPTVTTTYYVRGEGTCVNGGLCSSITITVNSAPATPGAITGPTMLCQSGNAIYTTATVPNATFYTWTLPNGWTGTSTNNTIAVNVGNAGGTVMVASGNGCGSSSVSPVTVIINPTVAFSQSINLCAGNSFTVGPNTYSASGTYTNLLVTNKGCDSLVTTKITVDPLIDVTVNLAGITLSANTSGATYQWIDCDTKIPVPTATNQAFTAMGSGNYAVIVIINNCSDTSNCVNISAVDLRKQFDNGKIRIYPNPTANEITIETNLTKGTITVLNAIGQELLNQKINNKKEVLRLTDFANGIYFIKITGQNHISINKVIKQE